MRYSFILTYIKDDNSLDYQKIYKEMYDITGFNKQKRQQDHYNYIVGLYNDWLKRDDNNS